MNKPINKITRSYERKLKEELAEKEAYLRGGLAEKIKEARAQGDLSENAEYDAAKDEQGEVAARIKEIKDILAHSEIRKAGISVVLYDIEMDEELEFEIVSTKEADIDEGKLSDESPIGKAVIGCKAGEEVEVETPSGIERFKILEITREEEEK